MLGTNEIRFNAATMAEILTNFLNVNFLHSSQPEVKVKSVKWSTVTSEFVVEYEQKCSEGNDEARPE